MKEWKWFSLSHVFSKILNWLSQSHARIFSVWCKMCGVAEWPAESNWLRTQKIILVLLFVKIIFKDNLFKNGTTLVQNLLICLFYVHIIIKNIFVEF
jgi:hypothetical protein